MNREMAAKFPSGIKALIVDDDAKFIKSSSTLLSLLNFKVASCGSPTSALKLLSGDKNKGVDVVLVNAEKATTCGFDFRGIVETDLRIPVIHFLSRHHVATGDEADELLRTLWASTYVLRAPLEAKDVCDLWMVIAWRKCYLDNKEKGPADPSRRAVQALMAGAGDSTVDDDDDDGRIHFKVVGAHGRRRKRKSSSSNFASSSSSSAGITVAAGEEPVKRHGKMNVTGGHEHERDDMSSQPAPQNHRAPAAALPLVRHHQQQQHRPSATSIEATATTSRARWNQPAAGGNVATPTAVANMATAGTYEPPEFSRCNHRQQQPDVVCPPLMFGPFPYRGPRPPVLKQAIPGPATVVGVGASAADADAGEYANAATSLLRFLKHGTETELHAGHDHDELAAMMVMDRYKECSNPPVAEAAATEALHNYNDNSSALMAPQQQQQQHIGHGVAANRDLYSTYSTSLMAPNQVLDIASNVNELTMAGGGAHDDGDASFMAPDGDQLAPGALDLDAISASLMGSPGHGAGMDGNAGIELDEMFSPDQYENTLFPLEALLGLGDAPVYETGDDDYQQQQGAAAGGSGTAADAAGTSLVGGGDAGDNLDILDDYLFMDNTGDFNNGRE